MSLVDRDLFPLIDKETSPKAVVIVGARRTGKTTLLEVLAKNMNRLDGIAAMIRLTVKSYNCLLPAMLNWH